MVPGGSMVAWRYTSHWISQTRFSLGAETTRCSGLTLILHVDHPYYDIRYDVAQLLHGPSPLVGPFTFPGAPPGSFIARGAPTWPGVSVSLRLLGQPTTPTKQRYAGQDPISNPNLRFHEHCRHTAVFTGCQLG